MGVVVEWCKALLLQENINENQRIPGLYLASSCLLGMDEWTWQYPELHPDQPRVTRLNHTEEILSPRVEVED